MATYQSVGSMTGAMIYCCCNTMSSAANSSQYPKGMDLGDVMQNGLTSVVMIGSVAAVIVLKATLVDIMLAVPSGNQLTHSHDQSPDM